MEILDIRRALRLLYPAKTEGAIAITTRRSRVEHRTDEGRDVENAQMA